VATQGQGQAGREPGVRVAAWYSAFYGLLLTSVLRATAPTKTASGKPSLAN
jgi:hypothetical protein